MESQVSSPSIAASSSDGPWYRTVTTEQWRVLAAAMQAVRDEEESAVSAIEQLLTGAGEAPSRLLRLLANEHDIDSLDELLELGNRILGR